MDEHCFINFSDKSDCFAPDVPNAKFRKLGTEKYLIECEAGYEIDNTTTSTILTCKDGEWSTGSCISKYLFHSWIV